MSYFLLNYAVLLGEDWFLYLNLSLAGLIAGSFCTTLIHRLPLMLEQEFQLNVPNNQIDKEGTPFRPFHPFDPLHKVSLSSPASHCTSCHKPIPFYLNIPLLGYLISGGKCTHCHKKIDIFYPITELACLLAALVAGWLWGASPVIIPMLLLFWALITLAIIDIRTGLLPDLLTLGVLWIGLLLNPWLPYASIRQAVLGAAIAYISLTVLNYVYKLLRQRDGMGGGDIKLFAALGAFFGWQSLLPILMVSSISGLIFFSTIAIAQGLWQRFSPSSPTTSSSLSEKEESFMHRQQIWGPHIVLAAFLYIVISLKIPYILQPFNIYLSL